MWQYIYITVGDALRISRMVIYIEFLRVSNLVLIFPEKSSKRIHSTVVIVNIKIYKFILQDYTVYGIEIVI